QERTLEIFRAMGRELERALPDPSPEQMERLTHLAACLAAEAGILPPSAPPPELEMLNEAAALLQAVINANSPPREIEGPLRRHAPLRELFDSLWAIRESALALANGDISVKITAKGTMAGALKTLQAHFNHLTWQTQRVADGDFTQRVDFMGEFSPAFNAMVERLASSVEALRQKEAELTAKNQELELEIQNRGLAETALRESEERYREMAITDHLTGLCNRRHFYVLAENEIKRTFRHGHDLSLIMLDLDHFKKVNDQYGHDCGDRVLAEVSRVVTNLIRSVDIFARYGGEEFILLLPETPGPTAAEMAERLREAVARACVPVGQNMVSVTVSMGIAGMGDNQDLRDAPKEPLEMLIKQADEALYASKDAGRNRVTIYPPAEN
ncbi:MAG: diguanylate cyclase, partial [Proteobacteria bacterium]|nr:diguanylate cyclase [Pseudomonadota bacterium]MBU1452669.1 diguanylate cyclase [Pseudomonadota bacterium]MBU2467192.1 diguanylate cyclase [Pseudomonadota bacterium]